MEKSRGCKTSCDSIVQRSKRSVMVQCDANAKGVWYWRTISVVEIVPRETGASRGGCQLMMMMVVDRSRDQEG